MPPFVLHGQGVRPCLLVVLHETESFEGTHGWVVVLGGSGRLGRGIVEFLTSRNRRVLCVDLARSCSCPRPTSDVLLPEIWEDAFSELWLGLEAAVGAPLGIDALITATRAPHGPRHPHSDSPTDGLAQHLAASFVVPIAAAVTVHPHLSDTPVPVVIFLSSTNATSISHQPMGYHAAHAALSQAARYLSVCWMGDVHVHCIQIGAIHTTPDSDESDQSPPHFPGVQQADLHASIAFLLEAQIPSLVGEPMILSAGRSHLDATAVHQDRFGDLSHY